MKRLKIQTLRQLSEYRTGPYRIYGYYETEKGKATKKIAIDKEWGPNEHFACFGSYMRGGFVQKGESNIFDDSETREFLPMFIKYNMAFEESLVEDSISTSLEHIDSYTRHFDRTLIELNEYIKTEYDAEHQIISVLPEGKVYRVYMMAYLTRLRTLFELPYSINSCFAEFFQDDFPELSLEEISYLLGTFISLASSGHGFYNPYSMGRVSVFMSFADIMKKAKTGKYYSSNSGDPRIIQSKTLKEVSYDTYRYPESVKKRYELLLQNKEEIIDNLFKKVKHEESVLSI